MRLLSAFLALAITTPAFSQTRGQAARSRTGTGSSAAAGSIGGGGGLSSSFQAGAGPARVTGSIAPLGQGPEVNAGPAGGSVDLPLSAISIDQAGPTVKAAEFGKSETPIPAVMNAGGDAQAGPTRLPPPSSPEDRPYFLHALVKLGAPQSVTEYLWSYLQQRHPGDQGKIYHSLRHSVEVAGMMTAMIEASGDALPARAKAALIVAAALHDVDPLRTPGTAPKVSETLRYLESDHPSQLMLWSVETAFGISRQQVLALIESTDFNPDAAAMAKLEEKAQASAAKAFDTGDQAWAQTWRLRLRLADKIASYVGSREYARRQALGLANEIRNGIAAATGKPAAQPTDEAILQGTPGFLAALKSDAHYGAVPADLRTSFESVVENFSQPAAAAAKPAVLPSVAARAPPDLLESARRYVASIMGARKPTDRETEVLLEDFFAARKISPASAEGRRVRAALMPSLSAAQAQAAGLLDPALRRHAAAFLAASREYGLSPKNIQDILRARGKVGQVASLNNRDSVDDAIHAAVQNFRMDRTVLEYPDNAQGRFMRGLVSSIQVKTGKSVEEIARAGAFAYVNFWGRNVRDASSGRDPDPNEPDMLFYIEFHDGRFRIGGYRQNKRFRQGGPDSGWVDVLKDWLTAGGVPESHLE